MKQTVLLLLLVAIVLAEPLSRNNEGRKSSTRSERKRELLEGNYGLKIRPIDNGVQFTEDYSRNRQQKNIPSSQEYGPPRAPHREYGAPKVSDVLSTQGRAVPAAVAHHLYSPGSAYQPRLRFELSKPVPSQILYSEHKIISDAFLPNHGFGPLQQLHSPLITVTQQENYERKESLDNKTPKNNPSLLDAQSLVNEGESCEKQEDLIRNFESQKTYKISESTGQSNGTPDQALRTQQENLRNLQNFESIKKAQLNLEPQTVLTYDELQPTLVDPFLPRVLPYNHPSQAIYSHQLLQTIYPTEIQRFPPNFFQQINQLGNQLTFKIETIEHAENEQANEEDEKKDDEKELIEDLSQSPQRADEQTSYERQTEVTSISPIPSPQPQALSYSRFSLGLPPPSNEIQFPLHVPLPSPTPPPQFQPLPQPQPQQLFVTPVSPQLIEQSTPRPILQPILQPNPQQFQPQQQLFQETTPQPTLEPRLHIVQPQLQPVPPQLQTIQSQSTLQPLLQTIQSQLQPIQPQLQIIQQTTTQPTLKLQLQPIQHLLKPLQPQLQIIQPTTLQPTLQPQLQPIQPHLEQIHPLFQHLSPQPTVQPATSVAPPKTLFTVASQPRTRGFIRFRQRPTTLSLRQNQQTLTTSFRNQPTLTTSSQSQQTLSTPEPVFSSTPLVVTTLNSQPLFTSQELNNFSDDVSTVATSIFPKSTESSSQQTQSSTTPASISIVPKFVSTLSTRSSLPPSPSSPPSTTTPSTLPPQPETETSIPTSQPSQQTLLTRNIDSQSQPTLPPLPSSESQSTELSSEPQILPTLQPGKQLISLEPLPTPQPFPVPPQLLSLQPVQITPQPEIPGIRAIPVQRYEISPAQPIQLQPLTSRQPIQLHPVNQQPVPAQIFEIKPLSVQIPIQVTPSPPPFEIRFATQLQVDEQYQQQSQLQQQQQHLQQQSQLQQAQLQQSQLLQQSQSNQQSQLQQQSQTQNQQKNQSQSEKTENNFVNNLVNPSQDDKEARVIHAQELLYQLYSPFLQQPVYPQAQEVLIQTPQFKAPLAIPSPYPTPLQATPAFSTQYFGKYAHDIFGGQPFAHYKKK